MSDINRALGEVDWHRWRVSRADMPFATAWAMSEARTKYCKPDGWREADRAPNETRLASGGDFVSLADVLREPAGVGRGLVVMNDINRQSSQLSAKASMSQAVTATRNQLLHVIFTSNGRE